MMMIIIIIIIIIITTIVTTSIQTMIWRRGVKLGNTDLGWPGEGGRKTSA